MAQLPGSLLDLLKTALESSQYALSLRQDNADVLLYVTHLSHHKLINPAMILQPHYIPDFSG